MAEQQFDTVRVVKFRVYTGRPGTSMYLLVRVFATQREMRAKLDGESWPAPRLPRGARGVMATQEMLTLVNGRYRRGPCIGTVNFCLPFLDMETVTHEFLHALFAWAERKGVRPQTKPRDEYVEEVLCYALGRFMRRFLRQAAELGLRISHAPAPVPRTSNVDLPWRRILTDLTPMDEYVQRKYGVTPKRNKGPRWRRNQRWPIGPKRKATRKRGA
jgi:hypothetical protein